MVNAIEEQMEETFIYSDVAQDFVLIKLAGKNSILHYVAEVMNGFDGNNMKSDIAS
jgi:phosphoserine phosphatase